jgi:putative transposase
VSLYKRDFVYEMYPTQAQREQIEKTLGCCRFVYNEALEHCKKQYEAKEKRPSYIDLQNRLPGLKAPHPWLEEADSQALKQACKGLSNAYANFFRNVKKGVRPSGFPRFKSKHFHRQSYVTTAAGIMAIEPGCVKLPKLGWVKASTPRIPKGQIKRAAVRRTATGRYEVSFLVEVEIQAKPVVGKVVGLDLGLAHLVTDSNGHFHENPKSLEKAQKKLRRAQQSLARKKKGSKNREKQRVKVAECHEHVTSQRKDHLHKLSTTITSENQVVVVESLDVKKMVKNKRLARLVSDAGMSEFVRLLEYKCEQWGRTFVQVPRFLPSSQACSECGSINPLVKNLGVRRWVCPACGERHDRDIGLPPVFVPTSELVKTVSWHPHSFIGLATS